MEITGTFTQIRFRGESGYVVAYFYIPEERDEIVTVGYMPEIQEEFTYKLTGKYVENANYGDTGSAHGGFRVKSMETAFIKEGHQEGFHSILPVMPEGQLVETVFHAGIGQDSPAHFRAERAWILFLSVIENDLSDLCFLYNKRNLQLFTQMTDTGEVEGFKPQSHCDG